MPDLTEGSFANQVKIVVMRRDFAVDWAFGITGAIEKIVRSNFPRDLRDWPLLRSFDFEAYELPSQYMTIVLKDKLSGIPSGPGVAEPFPYSNHPTLPPRVEEIELWQFYLRDRFGLKEEDAAFLVPVRDSGKNDALADYDLFSAGEQMFWNEQIAYVVSRYKAHLQALNASEQQQPTNVTYNVSGINARVNVESTDSSVNVVNVEADEVFRQLHVVLANVENEDERERISKSIDAMESAYGSRNFLTKYQEFISLAADHATIFAPLLPALTNLLS